MSDPDTLAPSAVDPAVLNAVQAFLYLEARLADDARYSAWLALWATGEVLYWVAPEPDTDPHSQVSYIFDNRERLEQRVARWEGGFAWAQSPRTKTSRIVGNIEIVDIDDATMTVAANVHIRTSRRGEKGVVVERASYRLARADCGYKLLEKKVVFLDSEEPVRNITFVL